MANHQVRKCSSNLQEIYFDIREIAVCKENDFIHEVWVFIKREITENSLCKGKCSHSTRNVYHGACGLEASSMIRDVKVLMNRSFNLFSIGDLFL
ncbi:hypothetical protein QL285_039672 [Trifolium repens]|nr:hypothetical protein QL285_039672 [Trifolium repens]